MKIAGIILIGIQFLAMFGSFAEDYARGDALGTNLISMFTITSATSISELIGYFLPLIIGIILIITAKKKASKQKPNQ